MHHIEAPAKARRHPVVYTVIALALVLPLLIGSGLFVRSLVAASFRTADQTRAAGSLASLVLTHQLDEETGIRAYASTHDPTFLQPFASGTARFDATIERLRTAIAAAGLPDEVAAVDDARSLNNAWLHTVADPILNNRVRDPLALQLRGKELVDRFRADIARIDSALNAREVTLGTEASRAVERVGLLLVVAILAIFALSIVFVVQQNRLFDRMENDRQRAEVESRRVESLRIAYTTEKRISETLQDAFMQRTLPTLPTLRFSATYTPATEETRVGGDWYDALELPGNRVLFAVGDVAGHGIEAAVTMSRTRQAIIASSMLDADPALLLSRVNAKLLQHPSRLVTAITGYADANAYEFAYSTAGHPPPVLIEPGRAPRLLDFGGPPLASVEWAEYRTHRVQTVPGAMLVLYTDGAIEHSRDVIEGEEILLAAAARAADAPDGDAAALIHRTIFDGRAVGDDVAILTIGFTADRRSGLTISAEDSRAGFTGRMATDRAAGSAIVRRPTGLRIAS